MELKITKGDWHIVDSTDQSLSIWASESECITTINYSFWDETYKAELKANAHLISTAPAMYDALEEYLNTLTRSYENDDLSECGYWDVQSKINSITDLLSKARGE